MAKTPDSDTVTVTGPDLDREAASLGAGISLAQTYACRATHEVTYYVRNGSVSVMVNRDADRVVHTTQIGG